MKRRPHGTPVLRATDESVEEGVPGGSDAVAGGAPDDDAGEGIHLGGDAALEVLKSARFVLRGRGHHAADHGPDRILRGGHALGAGDGDGFADGPLHDHPHSGIVEQPPGAQPEERRHRVCRRVQDRLLPERAADVGNGARGESRAGQACLKRLDRLFADMRPSAKDDLAEAGVKHPPVVEERGAVVVHGADDGRASGRKPLLVSQAVLHRDANALRTERLKAGRGRLGVLRLDRDQHVVRVESGQVAGGRLRANLEPRGGGSLHRQTPPPDRGKPRAARNDGDWNPGREARREDASDRPAPEHDEARRPARHG